MGVQIETITPGDGEDSFILIAINRQRNVVFYVFLKKIAFLNTFFPQFLGKTFPKKGQTVTVHYVGETLSLILYS